MPSIRRKDNMNISTNGSIKKMSDEEKTARARKNWAKLRMHIN
jgi:hypothetical protein